MPSMGPDVYATGQALYVLRAGRCDGDGPDLPERRAPHPLRTQLEDGTWFVGLGHSLSSRTSRPVSLVWSQPVHLDGRHGVGDDRAEADTLESDADASTLRRTVPGGRGVDNGWRQLIVSSPSGNHRSA